MTTLNRREKWLAIATAVAVALFFADRFVLTPALDSLDELDQREQQLTAGLQHASRVFKQRRESNDRWAQMTESGLSTDPAECERQILDAVRQWSRDARLSLISLQPERPMTEGSPREIGFQASARGSMQAVTAFLFAARQSSLPIRIERMHLSAADSGDVISLDLRLSTLYRAKVLP
jgi:Tfp pilus assembly protein PilO